MTEVAEEPCGDGRAVGVLGGRAGELCLEAAAAAGRQPTPPQQPTAEPDAGTPGRSVGYQIVQINMADGSVLAPPQLVTEPSSVLALGSLLLRMQAMRVRAALQQHTTQQPHARAAVAAVRVRACISVPYRRPWRNCRSRRAAPAPGWQGSRHRCRGRTTLLWRSARSHS